MFLLCMATCGLSALGPARTLPESLPVAVAGEKTSEGDFRLISDPGNAGRYVLDSPSVKYRGICKGLGPKTYARIFELLLRLKANTLWPAMHEQTEPFNFCPDNKKLADRYETRSERPHFRAATYGGARSYLPRSVTGPMSPAACSSFLSMAFHRVVV